MTDRTVSVNLIARISGYISPIRAATVATKDFVGELNKAAKAGKLDAVASGATRAGLALVGGFALINAAAARFEKQMSAVNAVAGATAAQMTQLSKAAIKAGQDTMFSATEAGKAEEELAKAGVSAADILGGALTGALSLAAAGSLDLAEAAEVAAKAMNVFDLSGKDVGHVADVLAAAANKSATDVHDLGFALRMGGLAAKQAGVSLEETVGTLAAFADNALSGSDAGTSFKQMLLQLASPTDQQATLMKQLGINAFDAAGNFIGLAKLAGVLQTQLKGLTQQQRLSALSIIFGSDAVRAASILYDEGEQGIRDYTRAVNDQGAASETARKKMDNLAGDVERLKGSLETLAIQSGSGTNTGLRLMAQSAEGLANQLGRLPGPLQTGITLTAGLTGAGLLLAGAWIKGRQRMAEVVEQLNAMGPAGERSARGLQATTKWAGRAVAAFAALEIVGAIGHMFATELNPQLDAATIGLARWAAEGKLAGEAARLFGADAEELQRALAATAGSGFSQYMDKVSAQLPFASDKIAEARDRVSAFDAALAQLVSSGNAEAANRLVADMAAKAKISIEDARKVLPGYTAALEVAAAGTKDQASAADAAAKSTADLARSLGFAAEEGETLTDVWKRLHGAMASADETMLAAQKAIDDVADAFASGSKSVAGNTSAVLENRIALADAAQAATAATQAYLANGGTVEGAAKIMHDFQVAAEAATGTTGKNKAAVHALAEELFKLPTTKAVPVSAPGADLAASDVWDFDKALRNLPSSKSVTLIYTTEYRAYRAGERAGRWGLLTEHAAFGTLREASLFSTRSPARYAFAEPATGGEAFVPKHGDYGRSMAILAQAAGWYGANVVPREQGWYGSGHAPAAAGGGGNEAPAPVVGTMVVNGTVGMSVQELVAAVTREMSWTRGV